MEAPPTESSIDKISAVYNGYRALHAPSVIAEAARLLDALYETASQHGHPREDRLGRLSGLITAAADATAGKYGRPATERSHTDTVSLQAELGLALLDEGLTPDVSRIPMATAVEPLPEGPSWGPDGRTGLAIALSPDSGWELLANLTRSRVFAIHAPATADGAREVAKMVAGIARGDLEDPFRKAAW